MHHEEWKKRAVEAVEISANIMGLNNLTNLLEIYMIHHDPIL
jgi:hypothetical protein